MLARGQVVCNEKHQPASSSIDIQNIPVNPLRNSIQICEFLEKISTMEKEKSLHRIDVSSGAQQLRAIPSLEFTKLWFDFLRLLYRVCNVPFHGLFIIVGNRLSAN